MESSYTCISNCLCVLGQLLVSVPHTQAAGLNNRTNIVSGDHGDVMLIIHALISTGATQGHHWQVCDSSSRQQVPLLAAVVMCGYCMLLERHRHPPQVSDSQLVLNRWRQWGTYVTRPQQGASNTQHSTSHFRNLAAVTIFSSTPHNRKQQVNILWLQTLWQLVLWISFL